MSSFLLISDFLSKPTFYWHVQPLNTSGCCTHTCLTALVHQIRRIPIKKRSNVSLFQQIWSLKVYFLTIGRCANDLSQQRRRRRRRDVTIVSSQEKGQHIWRKSGSESACMWMRWWNGTGPVWTRRRGEPPKRNMAFFTLKQRAFCRFGRRAHICANKTLIWR